MSLPRAFQRRSRQNFLDECSTSSSSSSSSESDNDSSLSLKDRITGLCSRRSSAQVRNSHRTRQETTKTRTTTTTATCTSTTLLPASRVSYSPETGFHHRQNNKNNKNNSNQASDLLLSCDTMEDDQQSTASDDTEELMRRILGETKQPIKTTTTTDCSDLQQPSLDPIPRARIASPQNGWIDTRSKNDPRMTEKVPFVHDPDCYQDVKHDATNRNDNHDDHDDDESSIATEELMRRLKHGTSAAANRETEITPVTTHLATTKQRAAGPPNPLQRSCSTTEPTAEEYVLPNFTDDSSLSSGDYDQDHENEKSNHRRVLEPSLSDERQRDDNTTGIRNVFHVKTLNSNNHRSPPVASFQHDPYVADQQQQTIQLVQQHSNSRHGSTTLVVEENQEQLHSLSSKIALPQKQLPSTRPNPYAAIAKQQTIRSCNAPKEASVFDAKKSPIKTLPSNQRTAPPTNGCDTRTSVSQNNCQKSYCTMGVPVDSTWSKSIENHIPKNRNLTTLSHPSPPCFDTDQLGAAAFLEEDNLTTAKPKMQNVVDLTNAGSIPEGLRKPKQAFEPGRIRNSMEQYRAQIFAQDDIDNFSDEDADARAFGFDSLRSVSRKTTSPVAAGDRPTRICQHGQFDEAPMDNPPHTHTTARRGFNPSNSLMRQPDSPFTVASGAQAEIERPRGAPLPGKWSSNEQATKRRKLRNAATSNTALVAGAVSRAGASVDPNNRRPIILSSSNIATAASCVNLAAQLASRSATNSIPTNRNDLRGGSGVGAGQYQMVHITKRNSIYDDEAEQVWTAPAVAKPSSRGGGGGVRNKRGRGRGKGGRGRGKGRGKSRGRGGGSGGRGRGNNNIGNNNAWSDYGSTTRFSAQSANEGSNLGTVGGAEITF